MANLSNLRRTKQDQQETIGLDSAGVLGITGQGAVHYTSLDSLPMTGLTEGSKALVETDEFNRLYLSDGNGWYNVGFNITYSPSWSTEPDAEYTIADSATPLVITALATDSDTPNLINQSVLSDSGQYLVDVTFDSSVFTFTPKSQDSIGQEVTAGNLTDSNTNSFSYTFKFSDGINIVSKITSFVYNFAAAITGGVGYGSFVDIDSSGTATRWSDGPNFGLVLNRSVEVAHVGGNKFIVVWIDTNENLWARGGSISNNTVTLGDPISVFTGGSNLVEIASNKDGTAVVVYDDWSGPFGYSTGSYTEDQEVWGRARVLYFSSGNNVALGSSQTVSPTPTSGQPHKFAFARIATDGYDNFIVHSAAYQSSATKPMNWCSLRRTGASGLSRPTSPTGVSGGQSITDLRLGSDPINHKVVGVSIANNPSVQNAYAHCWTVDSATGTATMNGSGTLLSYNGTLRTSGWRHSLHYDETVGSIVWVYSLLNSGTYLTTIDASSYTPTQGSVHSIFPLANQFDYTMKSYYNSTTNKTMFQFKNDSGYDAILPITVNSSSAISFDSNDAIKLADSDYGALIDWCDSDGEGVVVVYDGEGAGARIRAAKYTDNSSTIEPIVLDWHQEYYVTAKEVGGTLQVVQWAEFHSTHPDFDSATGVEARINIVRAIYHPHNVTINLGDTLNDSDFPSLSSNSLYHTFGLDDSTRTNGLHAPNGYELTGFKPKNISNYNKRWAMCYDYENIAGSGSVLRQLIDGHTLTGWQKKTWLTLEDDDGFTYEFRFARFYDTPNYEDPFVTYSNQQRF